MKPFAGRVSTFPRSGIREIMTLAHGRPDVIHLEVGEPSFNTPQHIIDGAFRAATEGSTKYTSNAGISSLRDILASRYTGQWNRPIDASQVMVTAGGVNALTAVMFALVEPGDEVLVPDPGFPNYLSVVALTSATTVAYSLHQEDAFVPRAEAIEPHISPRTKVLVINSPSNPTGTVFPIATVQSLVDLARRHDLFVIADDMYEALIFESEHYAAAAHDDDGRVITISGCSKTFAMTGWRLGYAIASPEIVVTASAFMEPLVSCAPSISQKAAEVAFSGPDNCVKEMCDAYRRRRGIAQSILEPEGLLPVVPGGAFYALVDLRHIDAPSDRISRELLEEYGVAVAPGITFGRNSEGYVRISLAGSDDDVRNGCNRIVEFARQR